MQEVVTGHVFVSPVHIKKLLPDIYNILLSSRLVLSGNKVPLGGRKNMKNCLDCQHKLLIEYQAIHYSKASTEMEM